MSEGRGRVSYEEAAEVGARVRAVRKELGLTTRAFGKAIGVSHSFVSVVERGLNRPSMELLRGLAEQYQVDLNWLLTGRGETRRTEGGVEGLAELAAAIRRTPALMGLLAGAVEPPAPPVDPALQALQDRVAAIHERGDAMELSVLTRVLDGLGR